MGALLWNAATRFNARLLLPAGACLSPASAMEACMPPWLERTSRLMNLLLYRTYRFPRTSDGKKIVRPLIFILAPKAQGRPL